MTARKLLEEAECLGIRIWREGDLIRAKAPVGVLTSEIRDEIVRHKPELLDAVGNEREDPADGKLLELCAERSGSESKYRRLTRYLRRTVGTPRGAGRLVQVFYDRAAVALTSEPERVVFFDPEEVEP